MTFSGTLRYEAVPADHIARRLRYDATVARPIRGAVVELYSSPANLLLASGVSDANGAYSVNVVNPAASVFLRVRAQLLQQASPGWDIRVVDNTQGAAQYVLDTPAFTVTGAAMTMNATAGSGWTGAGYGATRASAPFAILDTVYGALQKVRAADPTRAWPRLNLNWSTENRPSAGDFAQGLISSTLYAGAGVGGVHNIYVLGKADADTDEFDDHVVAHEFGHYLQNVGGRNDSIGGEHGAEALDMRVAFSEGWGDGWSAIATGSTVYVDTSGIGQASAGFHDFANAVPVDPGWYKSDSVAYLLWKLNQQLGFAPVWQALTGSATNSGTALSNLHQFAVALKSVAPGSAAAIDSLMATQGTTAADQWGEGETNGGANAAIAADVLPLYKSHPGLGATQQLCVTVDAQTPDPLNKLGNWAFTRVRLPATRAYSIVLAGGVDPDFTVHGPNRLRRIANGTVNASETLTVTLPAGEYVVAVNEYARAGRTCLTLTIN